MAMMKLPVVDTIEVDDMQRGYSETAYTKSIGRGENSALYGADYPCPAIAGMIAGALARLNGWSAGFERAAKRKGSDIFIGEERKVVAALQEALKDAWLKFNDAVKAERARTNGHVEPF